MVACARAVTGTVDTGGACFIDFGRLGHDAFRTYARSFRKNF
jgi:hypothetical protein